MKNNNKFITFLKLYFNPLFPLIILKNIFTSKEKRKKILESGIKAASCDTMNGVKDIIGLGISGTADEFNKRINKNFNKEVK